MSDGSTVSTSTVRDSRESTRPRPTEQEILDMLSKPANCGCGGAGSHAGGGGCGCGGLGGGLGGCHGH